MLNCLQISTFFLILTVLKLKYGKTKTTWDSNFFAWSLNLQSEFKNSYYFYLTSPYRVSLFHTPDKFYFFIPFQKADIQQARRENLERERSEKARKERVRGAELQRLTLGLEEIGGLGQLLSVFRTGWTVSRPEEEEKTRKRWTRSRRRLCTGRSASARPFQRISDASPLPERRSLYRPWLRS